MAPMINIGTRLRELRHVKGMSQGDVEKQTGLLRYYVSRVECEHVVPTLPTLERWAKALGYSLGEIFAGGEPSLRPAAIVASTSYEKRFFHLLKRVNEKDRKLLIFVATSMANRKGKNRRAK